MITEFLKPETIQEALHEKQTNPEALYIAGGSWINSSRSGLNPETVISLEKLNLTSVKRDGDDLIIGAAATFQDIIDNPLCPAVLRDCLLDFKNRNIRNQGTIGGAAALKNPAFPLCALLTAVAARLELASGEKINPKDYKNELILSIRYPLTVKAAVKSYSVTARGVRQITAAVGTRVVLAQDGGTIDILPFTAETTAAEMQEKIVSFTDYRCSEKFRKYTAAQLLSDCFKALKGN